MDKPFIDWWVEETAKVTDAPLVFLELSALSLVSICVGRSIHIMHGNRALYPNIWVALIGPSGEGRKSTCMELVESALDQITIDTAVRGEDGQVLTEGHDMIGSTNVSPQGFLRRWRSSRNASPYTRSLGGCLRDREWIGCQRISGRFWSCTTAQGN